MYTMSGFIQGTGNIMMTKSVSAFKVLTIWKREKNIWRGFSFRCNCDRQKYGDTEERPQFKEKPKAAETCVLVGENVS